MFTGLIEGTGHLLRIDRRGSDTRLMIRADFAMEKIVLGESIAVDGVCLTVVEFQRDVFAVDTSAETLQRSILGQKSPGHQVNLERALQLGDRLGGHLVSGHVDGIGTLVDRFREGRSWRLVFEAPDALMRYIIEKGSIAINGISLTVNGCEGNRFHVNIIPHTAGVTTIDDLQIGDRVNLETDMIGKYVEKMLRAWKGDSEPEPSGGAVDKAFLRKHGFF